MKYNTRATGKNTNVAELSDYNVEWGSDAALDSTLRVCVYDISRIKSSTLLLCHLSCFGVLDLNRLACC